MRYICEAGASYRARQRFHNVNRLGRITKIIGKRYRATRGKVGEKWTNTFERVVVYGVNGTARFDGCCWGYGGEGPRALVELLILCGVDKDSAEKVAFESTRKDECGIDWTITLETKAQVTADYGFVLGRELLHRAGLPTKTIEYMEVGEAPFVPEPANTYDRQAS